MDNTYVIASKYENFIRKVFNCDRNKHGAHLSYMQNAMFMEQGETYSKHLGSLDKQFHTVHGYIEKALLHLIKKSKNGNEKVSFQELLIKSQEATNAKELMIIVNIAFDKLKKI
ncbi:MULTISPECIES: hypothetical protein [Sphingobacterium]|uniref:hypothetical protein n=1 Tax=Sphingobacterium TaxID=28453 RepID=UPI00104EBC12|nr:MULTISPECIES: hypothetical protein [Sphingobacterium]MCW2263122.1 hypothetical protein [Sphingobacterium kitahiroshimense]TCR11895.1 hypothetical protein EDF67_103308 [Sphingobacterium sp. JUb78]